MEFRKNGGSFSGSVHEQVQTHISLTSVVPVSATQHEAFVYFNYPPGSRPRVVCLYFPPFFSEFLAPCWNSGCAVTHFQLHARSANFGVD